MTEVMFTANRLEDGVVIWLTNALGWSEAATQAAVFSDAGAEAACAEVAAACQRNFIIAAFGGGGWPCRQIDARAYPSRSRPDNHPATGQARPRPAAGTAGR